MQIRPFVPETDMAALVAIRNQIAPHVGAAASGAPSTKRFCG